jgi:hypothetical protein
VSEAHSPDPLALLERASEGLSDVEVTEAHGCDALAAAGRPYALVAGEGRVGVRLPDWDLFAAAYELPGSAPLYVNDERVGHWVVLPDEVRDDPGALRDWLRHAHALTAGRV